MIFKNLHGIIESRTWAIFTSTKCLLLRFQYLSWSTSVQRYRLRSRPGIFCCFVDCFLLFFTFSYLMNSRFHIPTPSSLIGSESTIIFLELQLRGSRISSSNLMYLKKSVCFLSSFRSFWSYRDRFWTFFASRSIKADMQLSRQSLSF